MMADRSTIVGTQSETAETTGKALPVTPELTASKTPTTVELTARAALQSNVSLGLSVDRANPATAPIAAESTFKLSTEQLRQLAKRLEQSPLGAEFEQREDYFAIASAAYQSDHEAAADPITRQLHSQIQLKARELASRTLRLSNAPGWQALPDVSQRLQKLVNQDLRRVVEQIGVLWAELVSLGSFVEQDDEIRETIDTSIDGLASDVRRSLVDVIQTTGPWLRRFPSARKLDDEHASFQMQRDALPPAREMLTAVKQGEIVRGEDVAVVDDALNAGEHIGHQSGKARSYGIFSVRNVTFGAVGLVAAGLAEGFFKDIGEEVAKHSHLAKRSVVFLLKSEEVLLRFLDDLPADIRAAVRTLIDDLKKRGDHPEFPLPKAPRPGRDGRAERRPTKVHFEGRQYFDDRLFVLELAPATTRSLTRSELDFGLFMQRERVHFPFGSRYGGEFLYCLGSAGT
jgi:hypothetical protein